MQGSKTQLILHLLAHGSKHAPINQRLTIYGLVPHLSFDVNSLSFQCFWGGSGSCQEASALFSLVFHVSALTVGLLQKFEKMCAKEKMSGDDIISDIKALSFS
jgi:hypothetical protein